MRKKNRDVFSGLLPRRRPPLLPLPSLRPRGLRRREGLRHLRRLPPEDRVPPPRGGRPGGVPRRLRHVRLLPAVPRGRAGPAAPAPRVPAAAPGGVAQVLRRRPGQAYTQGLAEDQGEEIFTLLKGIKFNLHVLWQAGEDKDGEALPWDFGAATESPKVRRLEDRMDRSYLNIDCL